MAGLSGANVSYDDFSSILDAPVLALLENLTSFDILADLHALQPAFKLPIDQALNLTVLELLSRYYDYIDIAHVHELLRYLNFSEFSAVAELSRAFNAFHQANNSIDASYHLQMLRDELSGSLQYMRNLSALSLPSLADIEQAERELATAAANGTRQAYNAGRRKYQVFKDWSQRSPMMMLLLFSVAEVVCTSVVPIPFGIVFMLLAGALYSLLLGSVIYLINNTLGAWVTFTLVRSQRAQIMSALGKYATTLRRLDEAILREGVYICLLWRCTPILPFVLSSALISMTGITQWQFLWTTFIGEIPVSLPIIAGAALGQKLFAEDIEKADSFSIASIVANTASLLVAIFLLYRLSMITRDVFGRSGVMDEVLAPKPPLLV